jgi:hypothetical protein
VGVLVYLLGIGANKRLRERRTMVSFQYLVIAFVVVLFLVPVASAVVEMVLMPMWALVTAVGEVAANRRRRLFAAGGEGGQGETNPNPGVQQPHQAGRSCGCDGASLVRCQHPSAGFSVASALLKHLLPPKR